MSDWISRDAVFEYLKSQLWIDGFVEVPADELIAAIRALPAVQPDAAAIREAARMLDDIVCGRGMFGVDPAQDLQWAMETAGAARALIDKPATKGNDA